MDTESYYMYMSVLQGPAVYCPLCEKEGHLKHSCPEELLPELVPIPKMTKSHKEMLSTLLKRIPSKIRSCGRKSVNNKFLSHTQNHPSRKLYTGYCVLVYRFFLV